MRNAEIALDAYRHFSTLSGNQHIASVYALEKLVELVQTKHIKTIVEIGLGIGSISYTLLNAAEMAGKSVKYFGTEANDFCLDALSKNLGDKFCKIHLCSSMDQLPDTVKADLIIVDGSDALLSRLVRIAAPHAVVFVEGLRSEQVNNLQQYFPKCLAVQTISAQKNPSFGPFPSHKWAGGGSIIFTQPTMAQRLQYLVERFNTTFRYRILRKMRK